MGLRKFRGTAVAARPIYMPGHFHLISVTSTVDSDAVRVYGFCLETVAGYRTGKCTALGARDEGDATD
jgi:urease beta subunit